MTGKKAAKTAIVVIWMIVIFWFSQKPADESTDMSQSVGHVVADVFVRDYQEWDTDEQERFVEHIDFGVRKTAHAMEYMVLGMLLTILILEYQQEIRKCAVYSLGVSVLYATSDEIHQIFIAGRSCRLMDVGIDSIGAICGIALIMLWRKIRKQKKKER